MSWRTGERGVGVEARGERVRVGVVVDSAGKLSCSIPDVSRSAKGLLEIVGMGRGEGESWCKGGIGRVVGVSKGVDEHVVWLFHSPQVIDELVVLKICISNDINCLINLQTD